MTIRWSGRVLVIVLVAVAAATLARAQEQVRIDGTVQWLTGQTLTLQSDTPGPTGYVIVGQTLVPVQGPHPMVSVDVSALPQSEYAFMRPGERVAVIGTLTSDGRRLTATSIIRGSGTQAP